MDWSVSGAWGRITSAARVDSTALKRGNMLLLRCSRNYFEYCIMQFLMAPWHLVPFVIALFCYLTKNIVAQTRTVKHREAKWKQTKERCFHRCRTSRWGHTVAHGSNIWTQLSMSAQTSAGSWIITMSEPKMRTKVKVHFLCYCLCAACT